MGCKLRNKDFLLLLLIGCIFCFLSSIIYISVTCRTAIAKNNVTKILADNELPVCIGNLVDQREYHYAKEVKGSYNSKRLMSDGGACKLVQYTASHIAACLDAMKEGQPVQTLHFLFMGDSRIRQQYFNFVRLIPDFDKISQPTIIPNAYHAEIEITSQILGLKLSFRWQPLINDNVIKTMRRWADSYETERPHLIFLSMAVHHMLPYAAVEHCNDFELYQDKVMELGPVLGQLANVSQIIWLSQYPSVDFYGNINSSNTAVFSEKIHLYNKAVHRILGNYPSIRIWDSSNLLAVEYSRSCVIIRRDVRFGPFSFKAHIGYANAYVTCKDYIHTGYSALSQATQLLLNDICNEHQVFYAL